MKSIIALRALSSSIIMTKTIFILFAFVCQSGVYSDPADYYEHYDDDNKSVAVIECAKLLRNETNDLPNDLKPLHDYKHFLCIIARRLELSRDVARYKWHHRVPILDTVREEAILRAMLREAYRHGLDPGWSAAFFRDQMEASRKFQIHLFDYWKSKNVTFGDREIVDLVRVIRPQLDAINRDLMRLAVISAQFRRTEWCAPLTDFQATSIALEFRFNRDDPRASLFRQIALRNVCRIA